MVDQPLDQAVAHRAPGVQIPPKAFGVSRNRQIAHSAIIFEVDP